MQNGQGHIVHLNSTPLVSVIILTYENYKNIYRTLDSVFMQDYNNIEVVISDDASENFDEKVIENYVQCNKSSNIKNVIMISNKKNLGTVAHANKIAKLSNGEYIKFLACGDAFYKETSLRKLQKFASKAEEDIITSISVVCSESLSEEYYTFPSKRRSKLVESSKPVKLYGILVFSNIISAVGSMFHRGFFERIGFNESYKFLEDLPLWLNLTRNNIRIPILNEITVKYAIGGNSSKNGTAYESKLLKNDLILCYEKEILKYIKDIPILKRKFILYRYEKLKYYNEMSIYNKFRFKCKYIFFEVYIFIKRIIKSMIIRLKKENYSE